MGMMPAASVHVYDLATGRHLTRLPYAKCSWSESLNKAGGLNVDVDMSGESNRIDLRSLLRTWKVLVSYERDGTVIHAGPLTSVEWDASSRRLSLTCGGGLTLLTKRLVLSRRLRDPWRDGKILVDEKHPAGDLRLTVRGSRRDIIRGLVDETMQWGALPFTLPKAEGGNLTMHYDAWDLATVASRIGELTDTEYRFPPSTSGGTLSFGIEAARTLTNTTPHKWNAVVPDSRVMFDGVSAAGDDLTTQAWLTGGKDDDRTYMCRRTSEQLTGQGWPMMQSADTGHTTVADLRELQEHAVQDLRVGTFPTETFKLRVGEEHDVRVGDQADITLDDDYYGRAMLRVRVTDVGGGSDTDWLTIQAKERG